tara:strand:- start:435 stop:1799 length:1365 start_codon:yes stop_codon:yes gene_type:complete
MATTNKGVLKFGTPGGATVDSASLNTRRLYDFSDRVADLTPEESPFFVYLSKVAKVPTTDPQFRFLEDRTKVSWSDRSFKLNGSHSVPAAGSTLTYTVTDADTPANSIDWLIKGMVFAIDYKENDSPETIIVRIESAPVDAGTSTTFTGRTISAIDGAETGADNTVCQVIGTSFEEGSGAPDVWQEELDNDYGYTQIFKTACEMTNTTRATVYRGYADEWQRIWNLKLREHKVDIERAMLFGQRASSNNIQYSEGVVGHIVKNGTAVVNDGALSYTSGAPYFRSCAQSELTYDRLLSDFEVVFDPARGGSSNKLGLAGFQVITFFNKLGGFSKNIANLGVTPNTDESTNAFNYDIQNIQGSFGHSLMKIDTVYGSLSMVKEPLFRGFSTGYLAMIDLDHVAYRPLVGNGVNRDTSITTNVQQADEDLRKDMILTEAGLEVTLPETHMLYNVEAS